ncbi:MAG TPA: acetyltransferase [Methylomusa anaerophila]|uniref:Putative acetyltransferase EpsM n=1 Tax=Methylomusa anaerophila TaxID=1930071 RepID=A0A348AGD0_9FIRM|nr:acetyltransferase [Methylomusa anaerophila]BBB90128.1 putative acetyltransferase EpsM [Methylomusa anaerophila]HML88148.1 acetyltransferase [Methylomusa anaerophila]
MSNLLIIGAGGHGKVVAEAAEFQGKWTKIAFLDDRTDITHVFNFGIFGKLNDYVNFVAEFEFAFVAIGDNEKRLLWIDKLLDTGYKIPAVIHPGAYVSKYGLIGEGTVVLPGAVVNTNSRIGKGCIININACIDHDCEIGNGVHISSGAVVRSMSTVGRLSYIGAGSCVKTGACLAERFILPDGKIAENQTIL